MKKETSKITIICYGNDECTTEIAGSKLDLVAALGALIENQDKNNVFRDILLTAMEIVSFKNFSENFQEPAVKKTTKKAVPKKAAPKKAVKK